MAYSERLKACKLPSKTKYDLHKYFVTKRALDVWNSLLDGVLSDTVTHSNLNLINSGNTNRLYMILEPKFLEPEVEVGIRY